MPPSTSKRTTNKVVAVTKRTSNITEVTTKGTTEVKVARSQTEANRISIQTTGISTTTMEETTSDDDDEGSLLWLYILLAILFVVIISGGVIGYFAWKKKWWKRDKKDKKNKKGAKKEPPKKETVFPKKQECVLRPHDENPELLPDNVWKKKGPIRIMKNLKGPIVHKMEGEKSQPLTKPIEFDFNNMEEFDIGPGIEKYTGESTTLSFGPLPKSDTVRALSHISVSDMSNASKKPSTMTIKKEMKEDGTQKEN